MEKVEFQKLKDNKAISVAELFDKEINSLSMNHEALINELRESLQRDIEQLKMENYCSKV